MKGTHADDDSQALSSGSTSICCWILKNRTSLSEFYIFIDFLECGFDEF